MAPKKIKVHYLIGSLDIGGAEVLALDVCNNRQQMLDVDMTLLYRKQGALTDKFVSSGIEMHQIGAAKSIRSLVQVRKMLGEQKCQVLHVHQAIDALRYKVATLFTPIKIVCTHHGFTFGRVLMKIIQWSYSVSTRNLFVSKHCYQLYLSHTKRVPRHSQILLNGIDSSRFNPPVSLKKRLALLPDDQIFCMTGNFYVDARDQYEVCKALVEVMPQLPNLHFVFIGAWSAPMESYVLKCKEIIAQHKLSDRVHFVGAIPNAAAALEDVSAFVYISHYETFGIALAEALMMGKPCIVNDYPALVELGEGFENIKVVPTGNLQVLAESIAEFAKGLAPDSQSKVVDTAKRLTIDEHLKELNTIYTTI